MTAFDVVELRAHQRASAALSGPDWDIRAPLDAPGHRGTPRPYPRALRQATGIGRRRSVDLARFFGEHWRDLGSRAPLESLRGVGEATARAARGVAQGLESLDRPQQSSARSTGGW